ncbi:Uncharacterised protein [Mycobacteroides abscessus subsp. abscessus]|nr:Uncharacterised protein [Mycobacteroides abscessus subsp. abscessus]
MLGRPTGHLNGMKAGGEFESARFRSLTGTSIRSNMMLPGEISVISDIGAIPSDVPR